MRTHARAVVIGGGNMGAAVLYHLAHEGWTDIVLVEKAELTSGATWHAGGPRQPDGGRSCARALP